MIRITRFALGALLFGLLAGSVSAQSLADAAKQQPKQKPKAAKVYTNDEIPAVAPPKEEPKAPAADANQANAATEATEAKPADEKSGTDAAEADKAPDPVAEKKKLQQEWKDKITAQKKVIADAEREIGLLERENKLRAAIFYADAGNRLRDDKKWAEEDRKYKEDVQKKRTELQEAQAKLEALRDQARKAGVPGALD